LNALISTAVAIMCLLGKSMSRIIFVCFQFLLAIMV